MPLPPYEKKSYKVTRRLKGNWYLGSYRYKFNISRIKVYLQGLKEGKLLGLKCRSCNHVSFPPRFICGRCLVKPDQWVELPDTATVATGTATYDIDDKAMEHPFAVVSVRQDGSDTMVLQNLSEDVNFHNVYVGMPLKVVWAPERKGEWTDLDHYAPVDDKMAVDLNKKEGSI